MKTSGEIDSIMKNTEQANKTGQLLVQLGNMVTWFRNLKLQDRGLTSSQAGALGYIQKHGNDGITVGNLARGLNLSNATVSEMLKIMEKKSLVIRCGDKADGRKSMVLLTNQGLAYEEYLKFVVSESENVLLRGMTKEEQSELNRLLCLALSNMNLFKTSD